MTEQEYLDATNLVRMRLISDALRASVFMDEKEDEISKKMAGLAHELIDALEKRVVGKCVG